MCLGIASGYHRKSKHGSNIPLQESTPPMPTVTPPKGKRLSGDCNGCMGAAFGDCDECSGTFKTTINTKDEEDMKESE